MRKFISIWTIVFLVFSLAFPMPFSVSSAEKEQSIEKVSLDRAESILNSDSFQKNRTKANIDEDDKIVEENDNGEVRVIIELKDDPGIVYANKNNLSIEKAMEEIEHNLVAEQEKVKETIHNSGISVDFLDNYTASFNGVSGKIKANDIEKIEKISNVKHVYISNEYNRPEPFMENSHDLINSGEAWNAGYKGEGMVVAVIDSGYDVNHKDFVLSDDTNPALGEDKVETLNLNGKYYTEKVPYGYNYYDQNDTIKESLGTSHGMHVAGTVAANGEIKGVAPESQFLAMRVFSNDPYYATTFSDIYIKAIDDAVKLGADALNLSLGSPAGFTEENSAEDIAIENAVENGIVASIAAGNEKNIGYNQPSKPWAENPDVGVIGSPGLKEASLAVASVDNVDENTFMYLTYSVDGEKKEAEMLVTPGSPSPKELPEDNEYVYAGLGSEADFAELGNEAEGNIALIQRGELDFALKLKNAQAAGATAVIIFNHEQGGEELISMDTGNETMEVPFLFIGHKAGAELEELVDSGALLSFEKNEGNFNGPLISDFSSWGVTSDLRLKPEITAPGGNIISTQNDDGYTTMSGTSMATPHVAGGAALVQQYMKSDKKFEELSISERTGLAKTLLMNTAYLTMDEYDNLYSPRVQGAGVMSLEGAIESPVVATNKETETGKIELKELDSKKLTLDLDVTNYGDESVDYTIETVVLTDQVEDGILTGTTREVVHETSNAEPFKLNGGSTKSLNVSVDFSNDSISKNSFIEGYITLKASDSTDLSIPFVGFYGDWNEPKILDNFIVNDPDGETYFNFAGMMGIGELWFPGVPYPFPEYFFYDTERIDMNPGAPIAEIEGTGVIVPHLSFLRNAETIEFNILDKDKQVVKTIGSDTKIPKNNVITRGGAGAITMANGLWDGTINGNPAEEGHYFYEIKSTINYPDAEPQSKLMPILVDTTAPEVTNIKFDEENNRLSWEAIDNGYPEDGVGIEQFTISNTLEEEDGEITVEADANESAFSVDVSELMEDNPENLYIWGYDKLLNSAVETIDVEEIPDEIHEPMIFLNSPDLNSFNNSNVYVQGYVGFYEALDKVLLGDEKVEADLEYHEHVTINFGNYIYEGPAYEFTKELEMEDGFHEMKVEAFAKDGSHDSITRRFYVDETPPELEYEVQERDLESNQATIEFHMKDNLPFLQLKQDGSELFKYDGFKSDSTPSDPVEKTFETTVTLEKGSNEFHVTLSDVVGQETKKTILINRGSVEDLSEKYSGDDRFKTAVDISERNFETSDTVILASGMNFPDALAGGPLASALDAPLLLSGETKVSSETLNEIERLGTKEVVLLGGEVSVSKAVEEQIQKIGVSVERIAGKDRFETAVLIADEINAITDSNQAFLVNGMNFADVLSVSSVAGRDGTPILLTKADTVNKNTSDAIKQWKVKDITVIGGEKVIEPESLLNLIGWGANINRVYGADRFETATAIANEFYPEATHAVFTDGMNFPDALAGSPMAAMKEAPVLLSRGNVLAAPITPYLERSDVGDAIFLGGTKAFKMSVRQEIINILKK